MKKVISTNNALVIIGPYSQAIEANGTIFISGLTLIDPLTGAFPIRSATAAKGLPKNCMVEIEAVAV